MNTTNEFLKNLEQSFIKVKFKNLKPDFSNIVEVYNNNLNIWYYFNSDIVTKKDGTKEVNSKIDTINNVILLNPENFIFSKKKDGFDLSEVDFIDNEHKVFESLLIEKLNVSEKKQYLFYNEYLSKHRSHIEWNLNDYYNHYISKGSFDFQVLWTFKSNEFDEISERINLYKRRYDYIFSKLSNEKKIEFKNDCIDNLEKLKSKQEYSKFKTLIQMQINEIKLSGSDENEQTLKTPETFEANLKLYLNEIKTSVGSLYNENKATINFINNEIKTLKKGLKIEQNILEKHKGLFPEIRKRKINILEAYIHFCKLKLNEIKPKENKAPDFAKGTLFTPDFNEIASEYNTGSNYQHKQDLIAVFWNSYINYQQKFESYYDRHKIIPFEYFNDLIFKFRQHFPKDESRMLGVSYFDDLIEQLLEKYQSNKDIKQPQPRQIDVVNNIEIKFNPNHFNQKGYDLFLYLVENYTLKEEKIIKFINIYYYLYREIKKDEVKNKLYTFNFIQDKYKEFIESNYHKKIKKFSKAEFDFNEQINVLNSLEEQFRRQQFK